MNISKTPSKMLRWMEDERQAIYPSPTFSRGNLHMSVLKYNP
jgi:hypothetical protein